MDNNWIWLAGRQGRNTFVRFRREFTLLEIEQTTLRISADSRYWVFLNGERLGFGPVRSWPNHWKYDEYDISAQLRVGRNVIAVLVNHFGEGNFQYLAADPGLWVEAYRTNASGRSSVFIQADRRWKSADAPAFLSVTPRISVQEAFEEQHDARLGDDWVTTEYDDSSWMQACEVKASHPTPEPSGIPLLTSEPVFPQRILRTESVRPADWTWSLNLKPYFAPEDLSSNISFVNGFLFTQVWSRVSQTATFLRPHRHAGLFYVNGLALPPVSGEMTLETHGRKVPLREGWNTVLVPYPSQEISPARVNVAGAVHLAQFALTVSAHHEIKWSVRGETTGSPWAFIGPYSPAEVQTGLIESHMDYPRVVCPPLHHPDATAEEFDQILCSGLIPSEVMQKSYFQELQEIDICRGDVVASSFADEVVKTARLENSEALLCNNSAWATLDVPEDGLDTRFLVDFGREVVGRQVFEVEATEGTIIDFHNFEFIQPDGRENYADGMNNSSRYICREGRQSYCTLQRRGFQYCWVTVRHATRPVRFRTVHVEFSTYPQATRGSFTSSDALLNEIWDVGAHTIRCCSEDTYTDCPTYEQAHWVGDARNEALVDWVINGDPRLWFRCLEQAAQSLERAPLIMSQVPSAWENILPAWSFLWMRSCREYLLWTGDGAGARKLFPWICKNVDGIEEHLNSQGLFDIQAWNMFDWAEMDTPTNGVVTHLNCFAVLALNECAELAQWLNEKEHARRFKKLAASIRDQINSHLWNDEEDAYVDCIHLDGRISEVFSQQTQTVALISGVALDERAARCRELVHRPPPHFVKAGSPFFEFFLLELLAAEGRDAAFLDVIRRDWGFMIEQGASTFWEMWSQKTGRLTRSHCHGWSAAPTYFLSSITLGVYPTKPGFEEVLISPKLGNLDFIRGAMPTPHGQIEVSCIKVGKEVKTILKVPKGVTVSPNSAPHTLIAS